MSPNDGVMIGDRYEETDAATAYRNLIEGEDAVERAAERQEAHEQARWEQQESRVSEIDESLTDADDSITAAVRDVECAMEAEAER